MKFLQDAVFLFALSAPCTLSKRLGEIIPRVDSLLDQRFEDYSQGNKERNLATESLSRTWDFDCGFWGCAFASNEDRESIKTFANLPVANGAVTLTFLYQGDIEASNEFASLYYQPPGTESWIYYASTGGGTQSNCNCCRRQSLRTIPMNDFNNSMRTLSDNSIRFKVKLPSTVDDSCSVNRATINLSIPYNTAPEARCRNVNKDSPGGCAYYRDNTDALAREIGTNSFDSDGDNLQYSLSRSVFPIGGPYWVTLTVRKKTKNAEKYQTQLI